MSTSQIMQVREKDARRLFIGLGYKAADDTKVWPVARLHEKMNRLTEYLEDADRIKEEKLKSLVKEVCSALEDGFEIVLVESKDSEENKERSSEMNVVSEKSEKGKKRGKSENGSENRAENGDEKEKMSSKPSKGNGSSSVPSSVPSSVEDEDEEKDEEMEVEEEMESDDDDGGEQKKPATPKKPRVPRHPKDPKPQREMDKFGFRVDTETGAFNRVLSATEPKTMGQIVKEANLKRGLYTHLKRLLNRGYIREVEDKGYILTGKVFSPSQPKDEDSD